MTVYAICGHGFEPVESIRIPPGCAIVVRSNPGCAMYRDEYDKHLKTLFCDESLSRVLKDPAAHISAIRAAFGSVIVFKEGDVCPNFSFKLLVDFPDLSQYAQVSGIIPVPTDGQPLCGAFSGSGNVWLQSPNFVKPYVPPKITNAKFEKYAKLMESMTPEQRPAIEGMVDSLLEFENRRRKNNYNRSIKNLASGYVEVKDDLPANKVLPLIYEHSIYPTKEDIASIVSDMGENPSIGDVVNSEALEKTMSIDLKTLFEKFPGTYYHFACRITTNLNTYYSLYEQNRNIKRNGTKISFVTRNVPAIYNTPVLKMPVEHQHYIKQAIYEAEHKKQQHTRRAKRRRHRKTRRRV